MFHDAPHIGKRAHAHRSRFAGLCCAMLCLALLAPIGAPSAAAVAGAPGLAVLVKNLNPATGPSTPSDFTMLGSTLFFTAFDPQHGRELWRSDGTEGGTTLLKDINQGVEDGGISHPTIFKNALYFLAYNHTVQLWRSDGTSAGTTLIHDFASPPYEVYARNLAVAGNNLFIVTFLLRNSNNQSFMVAAPLWRSDGTAAGTSIMFDFMNLPGISDVTDLTAIGNTLFLRAITSSSQTIYRSDGTAQGTIPLKQFASSSGLYGNVDQFTVVNNTLFFRANEVELWKSNGTPASTVLVKAMPRTPTSSAQPSIGPYPDPPDAGPRNLTSINGRLFFSSFYSGLWVSDGTSAGTKLLVSQPVSQIVDVQGIAFFAAGPSHSLWRSDGTPAGTYDIINLPGDPSELFNAGGTLFFRIITDPQSGTIANRSFQLWKSDGTLSGTTLLKAFVSPYIMPAALNQYVSDKLPVFAFANGRVYFAADDGVHGLEPWWSNGTPAGTVLAKDIAANYDSNPYGFISGNGAVFFGANGDAGGGELWRSDGTAAGTAQMFDINPTPTRVQVFQELDAGGTLFFLADTGHGQAELWRSDGTSAGTMLLKLFDISPSPSGYGPLLEPPRLRDAVGGTLLFSAQGQIWRSDGTAAGTVPLPGFSYNQDTHPISLNGQHFFAGCGLWRSDGTTAGTVKITDPCISQLLTFNGQLIFSQTVLPEPGVWASDGTAAGTVRLTTAAPGQMVQMGGKLFYFTFNPNATQTLWASDGTANGTVAITNIPAPAGSGVADIVSAGSRLFFRVWNQPTLASELWTSDGTANGTLALTALSNEYVPYPLFTGINGRLFFVKRGPLINDLYQLWVSDGTVAGTIKLKDQLSGPYGSVLPSLDGSVFFTTIAPIPPISVELWKSDGTFAGTQLLASILGNYSEGFVIINNTLFFTIGGKLWRSDGTANGTHTLLDASIPVYNAPPTLSDHKIFLAGSEGELLAIPISDGVDGYVAALATSFAPASGQGFIPISYANRGAQLASQLTLTVTLPDGLDYAGDDSGVTPAQTGNTLMWRLPDAGFLDTRMIYLRVSTPAAALGTRYPVTIALSSAEPDSNPADNSAGTVVQLARQQFVPLIAHP